MLLLALPAALAADVVLRNDVSDTYDTSDQLAWLAFPECAVAVLEANPADLPMDISYVEFMFASNTGNHDGTSTLADVGLQIIPEGGELERGSMDWGPEFFTVTVSSSSINRLGLVDETAGWEALTYTSGKVAVWICTPDPETGEAWPYTSERDKSGIVIDTSASADGSYIDLGNSGIFPLGDFINGAWVIHAGSGEVGGGTDTGDTGIPDDTGSVDTGDSGDTDVQDSGGEEGILSVQSVTPNSGVQGEAVTIAILGQGFEDGAQVYVGGLAASGVSLNGSTAISATTPTALPAGTHDIMVTNPGGESSTLAGAFTVAEPGCGCDAGASVAGAWAVLVGLAFATRRRSA